MLVAFDTSLLVAALREAHPHHLRAARWLAAAKRGHFRAIAPGPVLSETFSALTSIPGLRLKRSVAHALLTALLDQVELHPVSREAHVLAMARCARMGLVSGAIFDAVIMAAAEEANVDAVVTFNVTDFERFRAEGGPRVVLPPDPPAVAF